MLYVRVLSYPASIFGGFCECQAQGHLPFAQAGALSWGGAGYHNPTPRIP